MPPEHGPARLSHAVRFLVVLLLVPYVGWLILAYRYHFLDGVNLVIHEAGHVVFAPFGEVPGLLGGTLLQLAVPLAFTISFLRRGLVFEGAVCGIWTAESLMYTARYMADARALELPILGEVHDWNELLIRARLLERAELLGSLTHGIASVMALFCLGAAMWQVVGSDRVRPPART